MLVKTTGRSHILLVCGLLCLQALWLPSLADAQTVVFISTDSLTSTTRTISGVKSEIRLKYEKAVFHTVMAGGDAQITESFLVSIREKKPDILITVGSAATQIAKDNFAELPVVFSAVKYPLMSGFVESLARPGHRMTGASLDIPVDIQFRYFRQIIPGLKTVGVMYTSNTARLIPPARVIAAEMGLELVAIEIKGPRDLPKALDSLASVAQGLWSVADQNLYDPQSTKYILLNSLRQGLPFMGFSRYVVESGALFALDFDYKAIGRQAGRIAARVLDNTDPGTIPVTAPDIIWFHYNEKTAHHVKVAVPSDLVAIAKEVYR